MIIILKIFYILIIRIYKQLEIQRQLQRQKERELKKQEFEYYCDFVNNMLECKQQRIYFIQIKESILLIQNVCHKYLLHKKIFKMKEIAK